MAHAWGKERRPGLELGYGARACQSQNYSQGQAMGFKDSCASLETTMDP